MGAQGTATLDFGAFPGSVDASIVITGQSGILSTSLVEAWILPASTSSHSIADHYMDAPLVMAGEIVAGTGFTIRGFTNSRGGQFNGPVPFGTWNVAWVWN